MYKEFPQDIFDGTHAARPEPGAVVHPSNTDYWIIVRELQAVQEYLLHLAQNIKIMPGLKDELDVAMHNVREVKAEIERLQPPEELSRRVSAFESRLVSLDNRQDVGSLRSEILSLHDTITINQIKTLRLQESFANEVKGFQNKMMNMFKKLEKDSDDRLDALETKMSKVHLQAEVGNLLSRLEQM